MAAASGAPRGPACAALPAACQLSPVPGKLGVLESGACVQGKSSGRGAGHSFNTTQHPFGTTNLGNLPGRIQMPKGWGRGYLTLGEFFSPPSRDGKSFCFF